MAGLPLDTSIGSDLHELFIECCQDDDLPRLVQEVGKLMEKAMNRRMVELLQADAVSIVFSDQQWRDGRATGWADAQSFVLEMMEATP